MLLRLTATSAHGMSQAPQSGMTGMLCYIAPFNGNINSRDVTGATVSYGCHVRLRSAVQRNASSWDDAGVAVVYDDLFSYTTLFESEDSSRDVAGATFSYGWYVRLHGAVQRQRKLVWRLGRGG
jgi:hypothetical protein